MRKWLAVAAVAAVVCVLAEGVLLAPPGRGPGRMPGWGPKPEDLTYVEGTLKTVKWDAYKQTGSIVLSIEAKKGKEKTATLFANATTQVFKGDEPKTMSDLAEGQRAIVGFPKPKEGVTPVAVLIRMPPDKADDDKKEGADDSTEKTEGGD